MDSKDRSIVAQVCVKASAEVYTSLADMSQGFQPDLLEAIFRKCWQLHSATVDAAPTPAPPVEDPGAPFAPPVQAPVDPMQIPPPPPRPQDAPQPVAASLPAAVPSQGPQCPECQTPMVKTENWDAIAAAVAKKSPPGKPPPYWKCPRGTYDKQTRTAYGCQGCQWDAA